MQRKTKLIIIAAAALILIGSGIALAFPKIKNRFVAKNTSSSSPSNIDKTNALNQTIDPATGQAVSTESDASAPDAASGDNSSAPTTDSSNNVSGSDTSKINENLKGKMYAHITTEHCATDCQAFANNLSYFEYCQQVCGISPEKNVTNCDGKEGLQKDYCLKDLGIKKLDASICEKIEDVNIRNTCKNRISEDQIENQKTGPVE